MSTYHAWRWQSNVKFVYDYVAEVEYMNQVEENPWYCSFLQHTLAEKQLSYEIWDKLPNSGYHL